MHKGSGDIGRTWAGSVTAATRPAAAGTSRSRSGTGANSLIGTPAGGWRLPPPNTAAVTAPATAATAITLAVAGGAQRGLGGGRRRRPGTTAVVGGWRATSGAGATCAGFVGRRLRPRCCGAAARPLLGRDAIPTGRTGRLRRRWPRRTASSTGAGGTSTTTPVHRNAGGGRCYGIPRRFRWCASSPRCCCCRCPCR